MATLRPITLHEDNDETLLLTITPDDPAEDLTGVTSLELFLKPDNCTEDTAAGVLALSTADATEMIITGQTATQITAEAYIPASALSTPAGRFWHVDGLNATKRRTAMYGPVSVVNL